MKNFIFILCLLFTNILILNAQNSSSKISRLELTVESGLHLDINEIIDPYDYSNKPPFMPEDFQYKKVLAGWSNRIKVKYNFGGKWSASARIGFTTFEIEYEKSGSDIYGIFEGSTYIERYFPLDFLIERKINFKDDKSYLTIAIGPIIRFYDDSNYSYGITQDALGNFYIPGIFAESRNFADGGISYNLAFGKVINEGMDIGVNLNAYTLFYGYGLESIILAPYVNLKF